MFKFNYIFLGRYLTIFLLLISPYLSAQSPYAPKTVGTTPGGKDFAVYAYDSASNRLTNTVLAEVKQLITMGLVSKPTHIQQGEEEPDRFCYGIGGKRYLRIHEDGRKTFYLRGMEYRLWGDTPKTVVHIRAKGYSPDVQVEVTDSSNLQYTYVLKDHLGSPVHTVDNYGAAADPVRFDPWGLRVEATGVMSDLSAPQDVEKMRGYTGHELIAPATMNHMNGRVHDSQIGLFAGPDIFIQGSSIASLNRFALGQNNNPNIVDWSGWKSSLAFIGSTSLTEQEVSLLKTMLGQILDPNDGNRIALNADGNFIHASNSPILEKMRKVADHEDVHLDFEISTKRILPGTHQTHLEFGSDANHFVGKLEISVPMARKLLSGTKKEISQTLFELQGFADEALALADVATEQENKGIFDYLHRYQEKYPDESIVEQFLSFGKLPGSKIAAQNAALHRAVAAGDPKAMVRAREAALKIDDRILHQQDHLPNYPDAVSRSKAFGDFLHRIR